MTLGKRILITTNTLRAGGAEVQRVILANALASLGHKPVLVCLQQRGELEARVGHEVQIVDLGWRQQFGGRADALISGTTNTEVGFAMRNRHKVQGKWAVAIHNPVGDGAPQLSRFVRLGMRLASVRIGLTERHSELLFRESGLRCTHVIGNAADGEWFRDVRRFRRQNQDRPYQLGFLGRLSTHHKGIDRLLELMSAPQLDGFTLAVAGEGPDSRELMKTAHRRGLNDRIVWKGFVEPQEFFREIDVLLLLSRYEGQPMVLIEAEAAGVPAFGTVASGITSSSINHVTRETDAVAIALELREFCDRAKPESTALSMRTPGTMAAEYLTALGLGDSNV